MPYGIRKAMWLGVSTAARRGGDLVARVPVVANRLARAFEPWGVLCAFVGVVVASVGLMIDLEDRQSARVFRAWEVVLIATASPAEVRPDDSPPQVRRTGSSTREAMQYLNRQFSGAGCFWWVTALSKHLTGNDYRGCIFPAKQREALVGLSLSYSNLANARLRGAELARSALRGADVAAADLRDANLQHADLRGADLEGTDLRGANLQGACLSSSLMGPIYPTSLQRAKLSDADLRNADLRGADLRGANLERADLRGADLGDWEGVSIRWDGAKLAEVNLLNVTGIDCAILKRADRWERAFRDSHLDCEAEVPAIPEWMPEGGVIDYQLCPNGN